MDSGREVGKKMTGQYSWGLRTWICLYFKHLVSPGIGQNGETLEDVIVAKAISQVSQVKKTKIKNKLEWLCVSIVLNQVSLVKEDWTEPLNQDTIIETIIIFIIIIIRNIQIRVTLVQSTAK